MNITKYSPQEISSMSDNQLLKNTLSLRRVERASVAILCLHLSEISKRELHLSKGYKSLFEYCTRELNLSEGESGKRIRIARASVNFPSLIDAIGKGKLSLTAAALLCKHINVENEETLINSTIGKTTREIEPILAAINPSKPFTPTIRKSNSSIGISGKLSNDTSKGLGLFAEQDKNRLCENVAAESKARSDELDGKAKQSPPSEEIATECYNFRFAASKKFKQSVERLAEVLGYEYASSVLPKIFEHAIEAGLERSDPMRRRRRREKRNKQSVSNKESQCARTLEEKYKKNRYIPVSVRDQVFERAECRCQYVSEDGRRCSSRTELQIDHIKPYSLGGSNEADNLQLLCRAHNLLKARQELGREFVDNKICGD